MDSQRMSNSALIRTAVVRIVLLGVFMVLLLFLPAGTFRYWQAWGFLAILFIPVLFVGTYIYKNNKELFERRMRGGEKESRQKVIIFFSWIYLVSGFVLAGLDHRFGWSQVPIWLVVLSYAIILAGYGIVFWVFRTNTFASRIIEVNQGQRVIDTGLYGVVRHPMYLGCMIMYLFFPLGLGSYWALIPGTLIIPILVGRILNEETVLQRDLPGYSDYLKKVRFHLIPGIW